LEALGRSDLWSVEEEEDGERKKKQSRRNRQKGEE